MIHNANIGDGLDDGFSEGGFYDWQEEKFGDRGGVFELEGTKGARRVECEYADRVIVFKDAGSKAFQGAPIH